MSTISILFQIISANRIESETEAAIFGEGLISSLAVRTAQFAVGWYGRGALPSLPYHLQSGMPVVVRNVNIRELFNIAQTAVGQNRTLGNGNLRQS